METGQLGLRPGAETAESPEAAATILVVEDDPAVRAVLADLLAGAGYRVRTAEDGATTWRAVRESTPDLILLDLILPDIDGLLLCVGLRRQTDVPIIACSGTQRRGEPVLSLYCGADDFIGKPFRIDDLQARIAAVLRRAHRPQPFTEPHPDA
jgi:DNA-binding response OmpR family regulator